MRVSYSFCTAVALLAVFFTVANARISTINRLQDPDSKDACFPVRACVRRLERGEKSCPLLPVPQLSLLPFVAPGTYNLTELRTGVWTYFDGAHQSAILKIDRRLAVIDFPEATYDALVTATREILNGTVPRRVDMVYSHAHFDHIGAAKRYYDFIRDEFPRTNVQVWGSDETRREIKLSRSMKAVIPNIIVSNRVRTLSVGPDLDVKLSAVGGHSEQDLLVYIPRQNGEASVVMMVDVIYPRWAPFRNLAATTNVREYIAVHKKILELDVDFFMGGHVHIGTEKDVRRNLRFTHDLLRIAGRALTKVRQTDFDDAELNRIGDRAAPEFGNIWWSADVVQDLQIDVCYREMLARWGCTLAGLDLMLRSHCYTAIGYNIVSL